MSIIYGALERLETEQQPLANEHQSASGLRQENRTARSFLRTVITAFLFVLALANLTLWYLSHGSYSPTITSSATSLELESLQQDPLPPSDTEQTVVRIPSTSPANATDSSTVNPAHTMAGRGKEGTQIQQVAVASTNPMPEPVEAPSPAREAPIDLLDSPSENSVPGPAEQEIERERASWNTAAQRVDVDDIVDEARLALSKGRYQRALIVLQELQPIPDNRADFWLVKGSAYLGAGQLDLAQAALESARELAPDNAQIAVQQAILQQETGDHAGALQTLEAVADKHPDVPEIFLNQGYSQQAIGAERAATRSFRIFLRLTEGRSLYSGQRKAIEDWLMAES